MLFPQKQTYEVRWPSVCLPGSYTTPWDSIGATGHLFVSPQGEPLAYPVVSRTFQKLIQVIGLYGDNAQPVPRIHDLRHTATVRSLEGCPPDQVANHMLALSTYLGHSKLANTYWYIHATPHLMVGIADACRGQFEGEAP